MSWERFFFYLNRFNAVLILVVLLGFSAIVGFEYWAAKQWEQEWDRPDTVSSFGSEFEPETKIIGQAIDAKGGEIVAYFESNDNHERAEKAGVSITDPKSGKTLRLGLDDDEVLADLDFLYDRALENERVIGYIAKISDEARYPQGRADIVIGALPALTKNVVGRDIVFTDLPTVKSDGTLGVILWQTEEEAEVVSFRLEDGSVIDRAKISLPVIKVNHVSQGPGKADNPALLRKPGYATGPTNDSGL